MPRTTNNATQAKVPTTIMLRVACAGGSAACVPPETTSTLIRSKRPG